MKCAIPVNAAVTRAARDDHLHEAGFPKEALTEPFEAVWWKGEKKLKELSPVAEGRERNLLWRLLSDAGCSSLRRLRSSAKALPRLR